jgi:copper(I)-binding protein
MHPRIQKIVRFVNTTIATIFIVFSPVTSSFAQKITGAQSLTVERAWVRATVAGQSIGGAFMLIDNQSDIADRLISVNVDPNFADHAEIHQMVMDNDTMKMRELKELDIPPHTRVALAPGQYHVMLIGLKMPLDAGSQVPLTLIFKNAGAFVLKAIVSTMPQ